MTDTKYMYNCTPHYIVQVLQISELVNPCKYCRYMCPADLQLY